MPRTIPPLSHSAWQDYDQCPQKYAWSKLEKRKGLDDSTALTIGRLAHEGYEAYQRHFEEHGPTKGWEFKPSCNLSEQDTKDLAFLIRQFVRLQPFGEGQFPEVETALALDDRLQPVQVKQAPSGAMITPGNTLIRGKIDRFYFPESGVVDNVPTSVEITDWKTGHNEDDSELQAKLYAWMLWKHYPMLVNFKVNFWYARSGNTSPHTFTAYDLRGLDTDVQAKHKQIATTEKFDATPNAYCTWCQYRVECQAWKSLPIVTPGDKLLVYAQARAFVDGLEGQLKDLLMRSGTDARIVSGPCACEYRSTVTKSVNPEKLIDLIEMAEGVTRQDAYIMATKYLKVDNTKLPKAWLNDPVIGEALAEITTEKTSSRFWFGSSTKVEPRLKTDAAPEAVEPAKPAPVAIPDESMKQQIAPELVCSHCKNPGAPDRKDPNEVHCTSCGFVWRLVDPDETVQREAIAMAQLTDSPTLPGDYNHGKAIAQAHGCTPMDDFGCDRCKAARRHAQVVGWERPWYDCPDCKTSMPYVDGMPGTPELMDKAILQKRANQQAVAIDDEKLRRSLQAEIKTSSARHGLNADERALVMYAITGHKSARGVPTKGDASLEATATFLSNCSREQVKEAIEAGKAVRDAQ